jgi:1,4-dihydroxy-2-naphthoyl-CoA hydrolase
MSKIIWFTPVSLEELNRRARHSLSDHLGIEFTEIGDHFLIATMPADHRTIQPAGILHGGATCALAETVGSAAGNYCVDQREQMCVGLDININHLRPVQSGKVEAIAQPIHLGNTTQVWEIKVFNEKKKLIAISRLTLAVIKKALREDLPQGIKN